MSTDLGDDEVYCRDCGSVINKRAEICPECGIRQKEAESTAAEKDPGLAAAASFIVPGLGQVYNGQIAVGIVMGIITIGLALTGVGLILAIPLWIWLIYNAYKVAEVGGTDAVSSGGSSAATPRMGIRRALSWHIDRTDDPADAEKVRERFDSSKTWALSDEDTNFILEVVDEYHRETGNGSPDAIRDALGR